MAASALAPGDPTRIGRFLVEDVLGRGAMGVVYRAHDPVIERKVAIKLVRADLLGGEERAEYFARFQREAQAAGRCSHPNIVGVYDFALHGDNPYLAMEFVDGVSLDRSEMRAGRASPMEVAAIGRQLLDGLEAAHRCGITHRDIKPGNIMLTRDRVVKLADFGISRLDTSQLTELGTVIGTPAYMSPEQCRGEALDGRSDLFSVAVVLYELLTGRKPFTGASSPEIWHRLLHDEPADAATLRPGAPPGLLAAISGGLKKDRGARFQTAGAMASSLEVGDSKPTTEPDRTVVRGRAPAPDLDAADVSMIERRLAQHVGPIAPHLVRSAMRKAGGREALVETLAAEIDDKAKRDAFIAAAKGGLEGAGSAISSRPEMSAAEVAQVQTVLTRFVGPIARVLINRSAPGCGGIAELRERVAVHVPETDRAAFLRAATA